MNNDQSPSHETIAVRIEGLTKVFKTLTAVENVSLDIHKNEIFGLLGPNGAGKTTTINMICGLLPATQGRVTFVGYPGRDHKTLIGYCPQENIFYPKLTCMEQLIFVGQMYGISARELGLKAKMLLKLLGLEEKAHVRASNLSGGMKRRLNICLAIIHDPEILILDEPEAGLDPQSRILVRDFIKSLGKKKTIILTTHNMDEADRLADRLAIIDYGKLLLLNTPYNLKKTVGEGDILELVFENGNEQITNQFLGSIKPITPDITKGLNSVLIKHSNIIEHIADIKSKAQSAGLNISEIKLRENTLEDVFIHLTGRTLRQ
jgi:ABC-2 type transport system ATP-binding protein